MNIQLFTTKKNFDSGKAERWFKERGIRFQKIDILEKGFSRGELASVAAAVGGVDNLLDTNCRDRDALLLVQYTPEAYRLEKLLEYPVVLRAPVVRNGRQATVGFCPDVWKGWS